MRRCLIILFAPVDLISQNPSYPENLPVHQAITYTNWQLYPVLFQICDNMNSMAQPATSPDLAQVASSKPSGLAAALALSKDAHAGAALTGNGHTPGKKGGLQDAAYEEMRQALMDGRLRPGQAFTIRALAAVFGTSPMPVRDALKRLVAEHALEMLPNRSVVLPIMSRARFQEILQVRLSLESMIAARATSKITPAVIEAMAADHEAMCNALEAGTAVEYLAANRRFHFRLYEAAETVVMLPVVESMWMQVGPHLNQIFSARGRATRNADHHHNDLLRALRRQDATAAAKAVQDDLSDAADAILAANEFDERAPG